ncbi:MAG TPA: hypothetical protein VNQ76_21145 [Planctomicrobium sp.]|nr:hypothetical protein [Planctomicrobium sp.]
MAPRRTIIGMVRANGTDRHHAAFHRLFATAVWSVDVVGLAVFDLVTAMMLTIFLTADERSRLQAEIKVMAEQESPVNRLQPPEQKATNSGIEVGEILRKAKPEEQRSILHHFIQSLVLTFVNPEEKRADYSLRLFPEVRATHFLSEDGSKNGSENEKGPCQKLTTVPVC